MSTIWTRTSTVRTAEIKETQNSEMERIRTVKQRKYTGQDNEVTWVEEDTIEIGDWYEI